MITPNIFDTKIELKISEILHVPGDSPGVTPGVTAISLQLVALMIRQGSFDMIGEDRCYL